MTTAVFLMHYQHIFPRLLELIDEHECSQTRAAEILTLEGFRTSTGAPMNQPTVSRMLKVARQQARLKIVSVAESEPETPWEKMSIQERYQVVLAEEQEKQRQTEELFRAVVAEQQGLPSPFAV